MNKIDIQNEILNVLLKYDLTIEEMKDILSGTKYALEKIKVPESIFFKQKDGTITDKITENF